VTGVARRLPNEHGTSRSGEITEGRDSMFGSMVRRIEALPVPTG